MKAVPRLESKILSKSQFVALSKRLFLDDLTEYSLLYRGSINEFSSIKYHEKMRDLKKSKGPNYFPYPLFLFKT